MDYKGKRLLILGGAGVHCKVVEAAKEMGVYTIVTDYLVDSPAKLMADESIMLSILDVDAIVEYCREHPVDGVINFCNDPAQKAHQQICERLGLPCYGTAEQVHLLTNKQAFKKMCMENNVDVIPTYSEKDIKTDNIEYPVLVKPVDSRGSRGITVCRNECELLEAIGKAKSESSDGQVIIEKYMVGKQDFSMSYLVSEGKAYLVRTSDRYLGRVEDNLQRQCVCAISPSRYTEMYLEKVHSRIVRMLEKIGIRNAGVFMQGFVDGETVRFYDPGIRFGGSEYERLLKAATGIDTVKELIRYSLGGTMNNYDGKLAMCYNLAGYCAVQMLFTAKPGVISYMAGVDEVEKLPYVVSVEVKHGVGEVIPASGDVRQRILEVNALVKNDNVVIRECLAEIQSLVAVRDDKGENMLTPLFDIRHLDMD